MSIDCNCYWTIGPQMFNYSACSFNDHCHTSWAIKYYSNASDFFFKYLPNCPLECDSIQYETRLSSQNYPSKEEYNLSKQDTTFYNSYTRQGLNMTTYSEFKKYYFKINVFYDSMDYVYVSLSPKTTLIGLLSNLGGSIGALLGFTLFTFFEALEMLIHIILIIIF